MPDHRPTLEETPEGRAFSGDGRLHWNARVLIVFLLSLSAALFSVWGISIGWKNSLFDYYGFRQAQTAISSYYMMQGNPVLRYETPVLGPPWSIPFEFPLYQWIVASLARLFSLSLDTTGRFVSCAFYFLTFIPLADVLLSLRFKRIQIGVTRALFAASPFYIFNSRCVMIESTALFFSFCYVAAVLRLFNTKHLRRVALCVVLCGVVAGVVKVTTFAPFLLVGGAAVLVQFWRKHKAGSFRWQSASFVVICAIMLPVAVTAFWTHFADVQKSQNPIALQLTSQALRTWNFGTLAQRLHPRNYSRFVTAIDNYVGSGYALNGVLLLALLFNRKVLPATLACFALYAAAIELFFNLHYIHIYYAYANAVFLVVAAGITLGSLIDLRGWRGWLGVLAFVLMLACCGYRYFYGSFFHSTTMYQLQSTNAPGRPAAAGFVTQSTRPADVVVILGLTWSSEFPYQARRRSIMDAWPDQNVEPLKAAIANQGAERIAAVVACDDSKATPRLLTILETTALAGASAFAADNCEVYLRRPGMSGNTADLGR